MGGGKGAAIGAATGAGAGTLAAFLTGKKEIELPSETALTFHLSSVNVSARDISRLPRAGEDASRGQTGSGFRDRARDEGRMADIVFSPQERTLVSNWFRTNRSNLPPGLAKRDRLPPGLEKQLRERGTLPPGLQKRMQPLPGDLERQLRSLPGGYRRGIVGGNVVLMDERTSLIVDIIRNVMQ